MVHLSQRNTEFLTKDHPVNFQQDPNQERDGAEQLNAATSKEISGTKTLWLGTLINCKL